MSDHVLIVDDDAGIRNLLTQALFDAGYKVWASATAEDALTLLKSESIELVIADIVLPGMDGYGLLDRIRNEHNADVILLTGHTADHSYANAIRKGASDFVVKPLRIEELILRIERVFEERRLRQLRKEMMDELQHLVITDGLTGLHNSRHFFRQLTVEINRTNRYSRRLSLMLLDVDHFKQYNDDYGHLAGDDALAHVAEIMRSRLRGMDSAYRYGGEEFTILLPETGVEAALHVAERIRSAVAAEKFFPEKGKSAELTISIGVTEYRPPEDAMVFVRRADRAMYRSKSKGRNMVSMPSTDEASGP